MITNDNSQKRVFENASKRGQTKQSSLSFRYSVVPFWLSLSKTSGHSYTHFNSIFGFKKFGFQKIWVVGGPSFQPVIYLCWMISLYFWRSRWYFGRPSPCLTIWTTGFGTKSKSKSEKSRKSRSWRHDQTHSIAQLWEFLIFLRTSRKTTWKTTGWQCAVRFTQFLGQLLRIWRTSVSAGKKPERDLQRLTQIWSFPKIFRTKTHSSHTININQPLQERSSPFQNQTPKNIGFVVSKSTNHQQLNYSNIQWDHGQLDITEDEKGPWTIPDASL